MEDKWLFIFLIGFALAVMAPVMIGEYSKYECKKAGIEKGMSAEDILKLCN